jgi:hypothetical protein
MWSDFNSDSRSGYQSGPETESADDTEAMDIDADSSMLFDPKSQIYSFDNPGKYIFPENCVTAY